MFPTATVCVGESEAETYGAITGKLLVHPDDVQGIGPLRQWILDNVADETVLMVDDDVYGMYCLVGEHPRELGDDPETVEQAVRQCAQCAKDAGVSVFGFNQAPDVRKFRAFEPFALNGWLGGVIGFVGRRLRYERHLLLRADIDVCLKGLLHDRITWTDNRFSFKQRRFDNKGGNASLRSRERHKHELAYLQGTWGAHLRVKDGKTTTVLSLNVPRRQV